MEKAEKIAAELIATKDWRLAEKDAVAITLKASKVEISGGMKIRNFKEIYPDGFVVNSFREIR